MLSYIAIDTLAVAGAHCVHPDKADSSAAWEARVASHSAPLGVRAVSWPGPWGADGLDTQKALSDQAFIPWTRLQEGERVDTCETGSRSVSTGCVGRVWSLAAADSMDSRTGARVLSA